MTIFHLFSAVIFVGELKCSQIRSPPSPSFHHTNTPSFTVSNFACSQRSSTEIFYLIRKLSSSQALLRIMKLSAEEKARRKEERAELEAKQARELHNFDNAALADREKELKGVRHYAPLAPPTEKRYEV
jgi:hypothetical protein